MTRVGVVDCGTNSLRLLVADVEDGVLHEVSRHNEIVRLGEGVDASGRLAPAAMERAYAVLRHYAETCAEVGVERTRLAATSASRDAANADEFFAGVRVAFPGLQPEVVSGAEEADLSFVGATSALLARGEELGSTLVVDLGGGSTEFIRGHADPLRAEAAISVPLGSVRLTERLLRDTDERGAPTTGAIGAAAREIARHLDEVETVVPLRDVDTLVGVAGTVTALTALALRLDSYDRSRIHGAHVELQDMLDACERMYRSTREERASMPFLHPKRADVIAAGALVWSEIVRRTLFVSPRLSLRTSESDILDGMALRLA
ncbi:Ppx/GppA phosphatase family protein [Mobilicoccus pelagius]|uniref:Putative phosphatase n=1 Tax=Mobilicoccus pelagius NBRC 104925 TaxID=1089455 RepID=H5USC4_9MICO|nr:Ppx/GppA phosphatase family protein [Mobilicoccus pelagius]GAB48632.1 putative phosphatase [Mobilicoccus pelagius NBRC 104925]